MNYADGYPVRCKKLEGKLLLITPRIRAAIKSTSFGSEGFLDLMRIAVVSMTVEIALRPAARMVSPDSVFK